MKIVDVSVLIYACNSASEHHTRAREWWESALNGDESVGFNWLIVIGFLRMATNPVIFERPMSGDVAFRLVEQWLSLESVSLVPEKRDHWRLLRELTSATEASGNLVPDAHLAALAISYGATLVSCDNDFRRFPELRWENPLLGA